MKINTSNREKYKKPTVNFLVVDDQELMRSSIRKMLLDIYGRESKIELAKNGLEALAIFEKNEVKFLITDWHMPEMEGFELLQIVRKNPQFFDIPVLMVADEDKENKISHLAKNIIDGYHTKPFTEKELSEDIQTILQERENRTPLDNKISLLMRLGLQMQYDEAIELGKKMLDENFHPEVIYFIGLCYYSKQEYNTARDYIKKILEGGDPSDKATYLYGKICMALGDDEEALKCMKILSESDPFNIDAKVDLAEAYLNMGKNGEADKMIDSVLNSNPNKLNLTKLGKLFLKHQDLTKASQCLGQAGEPLPETVSIFNNYAIKLKKAGNLDESLVQYRKCLQADPDQSAVIFNMALLYYEKKDYTKTVKSLQSILNKNQNNEEVKQFLDHVTAEMKTQKELAGSPI
ncbi:MAG: tetratricopeptide repeat protein [Desulfobulbaceae bacterium]|nr:tetratricopeptide repeat protein [Desulfobulbaceae bacterium]